MIPIFLPFRSAPVLIALPGKTAIRHGQFVTKLPTTFSFTPFSTACITEPKSAPVISADPLPTACTAAADPPVNRFVAVSFSAAK